MWTDGLVEVLPALLGNPQLRPLAQASVAMLSITLDVVRNLHTGTFSSFALEHINITLEHSVDTVFLVCVVSSECVYMQTGFQL